MKKILKKMGVTDERSRSKKPEYFKGNKIDFPNSTVSKASRKYVKSMQSLK